MNAGSPRERLAAAPQRFVFDAAIRILSRAAGGRDPAEIVRFRSLSALAYPPADVLRIGPADGGQKPEMVVSVMGLLGPTGVLPRHYSETATAADRSRSPALHHFVDLLAHRLIACFARAGAKYRPNRIAEECGSAGDPLGRALLALTGYATSGLAGRMEAGVHPLQHYAGLFAAYPRSAERLQALVSDWLGRAVEVQQFAGAWLGLPADQQTRLGGRARPAQFAVLGRDATIGVRAWDVQAGIVLRIGPLDRAAFEMLLPHGPALPRLVALTRAYLGLATRFAINLVVAAASVPATRLLASADPAPRLGWNTWLGCPPGSRRRDAADAVFEAEVIEAFPAER